MTFDLFFGVPEMMDYWNELNAKVDNKLATKEEIKFFNKLKKTLRLLITNPKHNSLKTHEIEILSQRYGMKVWQSYIENNKPAAARLYWVYHPVGGITIIGIEPHPNDNKHSYETITLSAS